MVRFFFGAATDLAGAPRMLRRSLFKFSICSLIAAARLSWLIVRSCKFMALVNIQNWWKSSTGQVQTMPSLKVCALVKIDGGAESIPDGFLVFHVSITSHEHVHGSCSSANRFSGNQIGHTGYSVGLILQEGQSINRGHAPITGSETLKPKASKLRLEP